MPVVHDVGRTVGMRVGSFPLGMGLENVVHHRQAEAVHQLLMELHVTVVHAVTHTMEVIQQMPNLFVGEFDDGILVQRDTASDAVVVRWQQVLQMLVVGSKPLHLQESACAARFLIRWGIGITTRSFFAIW